jgi:hypothetical protein
VDGLAALERRGLETVEVGDAGVVEGGEELRLALEAGARSASWASGSGRTLTATVRSSRVSRAR